MKRVLRILTAAACSGAALTTSAVAQSDYQWDGVLNSPWSTASNWLVGGVPPATGPGVGDNIVTPNTFQNSDLRGGTFSINNFSYDSASSWTVLNQTSPSNLTITGTLSKAGAGTLTFRNSSSTINLNVENTSVSAGILNFGGGITGTQALTQLTLNTVDISGGMLSINVGTASGAGAGTATINGLMTVNSGTVNLRGQGAGGSLGTTTVSVNGLTGSSGAVQVNANSNAASSHFAILNLTTSSGTQTYSGAVRNGSGGALNVLSVTKTGNGTQVFAGVTTYTGTTSISGGTLLVNTNHTGAGAYTIGGTGTLGGIGTITTAGNASVTLLAGGKLSPGQSAGTLTFNLGTGELDISAGVTPVASAALLFELGDPLVLSASDQILLSNANSTLDIGTGVLEFDDFSFTPLAGFGEGTYTLINTGATISGTLGADLTGTIGAFNGTISLANGGQDIILTVTAIPEPATLALLGLGALALLHRRRRS